MDHMKTDEQSKEDSLEETGNLSPQKQETREEKEDLFVTIKKQPREDSYYRENMKENSCPEVINSKSSKRWQIQDCRD